MKNRIIEILNNNITESKNDYNKIYEKDFDNLANELLEAINYTRCCTELKCLMEDDKPNCNCELNHCNKQGW